jgi:ArsR family transcriptional regulator
MKIKVSKAPMQTVFRALADQTRLRILNLLQEGELCVCHLVAVLDVPQPTASRHLAYLRRAGLIVARKEGLWMHYRLVPAGSKSREVLLQCLTHCFQENGLFARDKDKLRNRVHGACGC